MSKEKEFVDMLNKEMNELKTAHYTEHLEQENAQLKQSVEHWHKLFKEKNHQFESVRQRYHLLNRLQADYSKENKLHLSEMHCLELVEENEKLKQQLAEKDKEIEQLKEECNKLSDREFEHFGDMKTYKNMWLKEQKQSVKLRHEICEKIRNMTHDYFEFPICENCGETLFASSDVIMTGSDFEKILQEIEKGEE